MVWLRIAAVYFGARIVTTAFLVLAGVLSPADSRFGPNASLATYVVAWDAQWYQRIARDGYPVELPLTDAGEVAHNAWAFMPLFPWLGNLVGWPFGSWAVGAVVIALVAGLLCCVVLRLLLVERIGETATLWAVAFFACAPVAAMFQVAYAETLFLLLVLLALVCVQRRRYAWLYAIVPVMAYLRPGVLSIALFLGMFGIWRWLDRRREPVRASEVMHVVALGGLATALGFSWPLIASAATGRADAYLATELSWRRLWMGDEGGFLPFEGWFQAADYWLREWGMNPWFAGIVVIALAAAVAAVLLFEPHVRRLGIEVRLWSASYAVYLFAVFLPQSSLLRLLFPLSPLWGAVAQPTSRVWRIGVLAACLVGQAWWIWNVYGLGTEFWHIP